MIQTGIEYVRGEFADFLKTEHGVSKQQVEKALERRISQPNHSYLAKDFNVADFAGLTHSSWQPVFVEPGLSDGDTHIDPIVEKVQAINPVDVLAHNRMTADLVGEEATRQIAVLKNMAFSICPTDGAGAYKGVNASFPPDNIRITEGMINHQYATEFDKGFFIPQGFFPPANMGHESLMVIGGITDFAREKYGYENGDIALFDINNQSGKELHKPALFAADGIAFYAVGNDEQPVPWMMHQNGRAVGPGQIGSEDHFTVGNVDNFQLVLKHHEKIDSLEKLVLFKQADAFGGAKTLCAAMGIDNYLERSSTIVFDGHGKRTEDRNEKPIVWVRGAGHLGTIYALVIKHFIPDAEMYFFDNNQHHLDTIGKMHGTQGKPFPKDHLINVNELGDDPYNPELILSKMGNRKPTFIVDALPHYAVTPKDINNLVANLLDKGGAYGMARHIPLSGNEETVEALGYENVMNGKRVVNGLSPLNNMGWAVEFIKDHINYLSNPDFK